MNKNILKKAILIATSLWAGQLMAVGFTVPNTFESGTAASAAEVNANFDAIETGIDNNSNSINTNVTDINTNTANIAALSGGGASAVQLKDANGVFVGRVLGIGNLTNVSFLTDEGYRSITDILFGSVRFAKRILFETGDCSGTVYHNEDSVRGTVISTMPPYFDDTAAAYAAGYLTYVPHDAVKSSVSIASRISWSGACEGLTPALTQVYTGILNDPSVTGVANTSYAIDMKFE